MAKHHPFQDVEYLQEILLKSYEIGFPILKELIQNAEDAGSTHFDYGWLSGFSESEHPLLRSPALFIIDNGKFTASNADSIRYILGHSSKPIERDAIGKFGLGLKSVFHLCEAFFYIAPEETYTFDREEIRGFDIFNPWADSDNSDKYHENWNSFSENDKRFILDKLNPLLKKSEYSNNSWFVIWIPLRHRTHCTELRDKDNIPIGCIKNNDEDFFGEEIVPEFLKSNETKRQLSLLLPLLRSISTIRYWENTLDNSQDNSQFETHLKVNAQRHEKLSVLEPSNRRELGGIIQTAKGNELKFAGYEVISEHKDFTDLLNNFSLTRFRNIKPHIGITFHRWDSSSEDSSGLSLQMVVFLPIGEAKTFEFKSKYTYCLSLHGYFFVDYARKGIVGWDDNKLSVTDTETDNEKRWNQRLYTELLKHLLPTFDRFVRECQINESEISAICSALKKSPLFRGNNPQSICESHQWIYSLGSDLNSSKWQLKGIDQILELPAAEGTADIPEFLWSLFPNIRQLADRSILTVKGKPNLIKNKNTWEPTEILEVLDELDLFGDRDTCINRFTYCLSWLKTEAKQHLNKPEVEKLLAKGITDAWKKIAELEQQADEIMISTLEIYKLTLQTFKDEEAISDLLDGLISLCQSSNLNITTCERCLREFITFLHQITSSLQYRNCFRWLSELGNYLKIPQNFARHSALKVVVEILRKSGDDRSSLIQETSNYKILSGHKYTASAQRAVSQSEQAFSLQELTDLKLANRLFANSNTSRRLARELTELLPNLTIVLVEVDIVGEIFSSERILDCDEQTSTDAILAASSITNDIDVRCKWVKKLLACQNVSHNQATCVRYLLNKAQQTNEAEILWMLEDNSVWNAVAKKLIPDRQLIDLELTTRLSQELTGSQQQRLEQWNVSKLTTESVQPFLIKAEKEECFIEILAAIATLQEKGQLSDSLKQALQNTRWLRDREKMEIVAPDSILRLPEKLSEYESRLALAEWGKFTISNLHSDILQRQDVLKVIMPAVWTEVQTITFILERENRHEYTDVILTAIDNRIPDDPILQENLKQKKWLTLKKTDKPIAPHSILTFPPLQNMSSFPNCLQEVLPDGYALLSMLADSCIGRVPNNLFDYQNESKTIDLILEGVNKPAYKEQKLWQVILKLIEIHKDRLDSKTIERLTSKLWLPSKTSDRLLAPNLILKLDELQEIIDPFIHGSSLYSSINDLDDKVSEHPWLKDNLFTSRDKTLEHLGGILREKPECHIGIFDIGIFDSGELTLEILVIVFDGIPMDQLPIKSLGILREIFHAEDFSREVKQRLLENLRGEIQPLTFVKIFNSLANPNTKPSEETISVYNTYLSMACIAFSKGIETQILPKQILPNISLLNREQRWKLVKDLCYCDDRNDKHIASEYVLDDRQADIIRAYIVNRSGN